MIDDRMQFIILEANERRVVTFNDNDKRYIISIDNIYITSSTYIENILLADRLKHNLLNISQFCDKYF